MDLLRLITKLENAARNCDRRVWKYREPSSYFGSGGLEYDLAESDMRDLLGEAAKALKEHESVHR